MSTETKVHSGILFDIYQREQEQFDGVSLDRWQGFLMYIFSIAIDQQKSCQTLQGVRFELGGAPLPLWGPSHPKSYNIGSFFQVGFDVGYRSFLLVLLGQALNGSCRLFRRFCIHLFIARNCQVIAGQSLDPGGEKIDIISVTFDQLINMIGEGPLGRGELRADILQMRIDNALDTFRKDIFK